MKIGKNAVCSVAAGILLATASGIASAAETATATISSSSLGGGVFQYNIALTNTSADSSQIGTLWFSWIPVPNVDYMEAKPTNTSAPAGWITLIDGANNGTDGNSIEYYNLGGAPDQLTAGNTFNFSFDSTETLSQILGPSSYYNNASETTSFVYSGFPENDAGFQFSVTAVPEPVSCTVLMGAVALLGIRRPRRA